MLASGKTKTLVIRPSEFYVQKNTRDIRAVMEVIKSDHAKEIRSVYDPLEAHCKDFARRHGLIVYGGTALNAILPEGHKIYLSDSRDINDVDCLSTTPQEHILQLRDELCAKEVQLLEAREGMHTGSFVLNVNRGSKIMDISPIKPIMEQHLKASCIVIDGVHYVSPDFMLYAFHTQFSHPNIQVHRWEKMFMRFVKLIDAYPISFEPDCMYGRTLLDTTVKKALRVATLWVRKLGRPIVGSYAVNILQEAVDQKKASRGGKKDLDNDDEEDLEEEAAEKDLFETPQHAGEGKIKDGKKGKLKKTEKAEKDKKRKKKDDKKLVLPGIPLPIPPAIIPIQMMNILSEDTADHNEIVKYCEGIACLEFLSENPEQDCKSITQAISKVLDKDADKQHVMSVVAPLVTKDERKPLNVEDTIALNTKTHIYVDDVLLVSIVHSQYCDAVVSIRNVVIGNVDTILANMYNQLLFQVDMVPETENGLRCLIGNLYEMQFNKENISRNKLFRRFRLECQGKEPSFKEIFLMKYSRPQVVFRCPNEISEQRRRERHEKKHEMKQQQHNRNKDQGAHDSEKKKKKKKKRNKNKQQVPPAAV